MRNRRRVKGNLPPRKAAGSPDREGRGVDRNGGARHPSVMRPSRKKLAALPLAMSVPGVCAADDHGAALYAQHCASCHGARLEGQPDWHRPNPDGTYPAPPHDETGHTWHHGDRMLADYVARGGAAVLADSGVTGFVSAMPAFGEVLDAADIAAVLAYIRSTWPPHIQEIQRARTAAEAIEGN